MISDTTDQSGYASSPCFAHELVADGCGVAPVDPQTTKDVAVWRKSARATLISARLKLPVAERMTVAERVAGQLASLIKHTTDSVVSVYWPFRGELDLRNWMRSLSDSGTRVVLPIVKIKNQPLQFREWKPGCRMEKGIWNIPVPVDGAILTPDIVIAPLVGFDPAHFRLGYGGGYYDRTLASLSPRPKVFGVGYASSSLNTIYPQPHDIAMDAILTGEATVVERAT